MKKSGYKKFKKQEKARVKLKGKKTILPKGQNVTDTNFKVKKIVVKDQLKGHCENEVLTKKHLSIKDLISRLNHHNVGMRQEALAGLKEMVTLHGSDIVLANLSILLQAVMPLTVDLESDVRKDTIKLLSSVFDKGREEQLLPLFPFVVCHLTCAMTHIEPAIRADSLHLLDTMLITLPELTAMHAPTLLQHFLDLIAQQGAGSDQARSLSLHLDSRVTSDKWRSKVIGRLNRLFSVIYDQLKSEKSESEISIKCTNKYPVYLRIYSPVSMRRKSTNCSVNIPIQEYTKILMPLLVDAFIEAVPKLDQEDSQEACVVGVDVANLLQSILEIMLHIWNLLKLSPEGDLKTKWFAKSFGVLVVTHLVKGRFPYSISSFNSRKRKRESEHTLTTLQMTKDREPSCFLLNLQLCLLTFLLTSPGDLWTQSIVYIKRSLRNMGPLSSEERALLCRCLEVVSEHPLPDDTPSLLGLLSKCDILNNIDNPAFEFLNSIALRPNHLLHQDKQLLTWLDALPGLLCQSSIPLSMVKALSSIATCGLTSFTNSLDGWIEAIITNLMDLKVIGDKGIEGKKMILNLLYWVTDWDKELVTTVRNEICQGSLSQELTEHLRDVLLFKFHNTEDPVFQLILGN